MKKKYSASANIEVITLLLNNGVNFIVKRRKLSATRRLFFLATDKKIAVLQSMTCWHLVEEDDDMDFDNWEVLLNN